MKESGIWYPGNKYPCCTCGIQRINSQGLWGSTLQGGTAQTSLLLVRIGPLHSTFRRCAWHTASKVAKTSKIIHTNSNDSWGAITVVFLPWPSSISFNVGFQPHFLQMKRTQILHHNPNMFAFFSFRL